MSSIPNSYIDDLRSIVLATLNRIEQLRMRVVFGLEMLKGAFGQELVFDSDGNIVVKSFKFENLASAPDTPYKGLTYYDTVTDTLESYINSGWVSIGAAGGASNHSLLSNLNWAAAGHTIDTDIAMGANKITGLAAATLNGDALRYEHLAADDHTQYYNSTRHTKAIHDALNIDADALDGKNAIDFLWLDGSLTMASDFKLNADLILYDTIIRDCSGLYAPDNLDLNIGINNGVGVYNTKITIDDNGTKLYDGLNINAQPLTNLTNIYSNDSASSYTRFYNVNAGNTLKFEINKSFNTSHQILDMNDNNIIHCGALSGDLGAELVIESKYHALGLTAESGYDVDVFRTLDLNDNAIINAAIAGTDSVSFIIDQDNAGAGVSSSLRFNRGSTDGDAAIWWDEGDDEFQFESDVGVTIGSILIDECRHGGSVKTSRNPSTGDYEIEVASGDSIVFKAV